MDSRLQNYSLADSSVGICQHPGRDFVFSLPHSAFPLTPLLLRALLEPKLDCSPLSSKDQDPARIIPALARLGEWADRPGSLPLQEDLVTGYHGLKWIGDVTGRKCTSYELAEVGLKKKKKSLFIAQRKLAAD